MRTGERGSEEGRMHRSLTVEPITGGRGGQTGREQHAGDGVVAAAVRVDGRCAL
jgi:hypothetical protein